MRARHALSCALVGCAAWSGACAPRRAATVRDPAGARRFEIIDVADSTFRFILGNTPWIRPGDVGIAVDPTRRDALVARFVVQRRVGDTAVVVVTGQTSRVANTQVVLMSPPRPRVSRDGAFWLGALAGVAVGVSAALTIR